MFAVCLSCVCVSVLWVFYLGPRRRRVRLHRGAEGALDAQPHLVVRELRSADFDKGFLDLLAQLTQVGHVSRRCFYRRYRKLQDTGQIVVAVVHDTAKDRIVAAGTLLVEPKFIHDCGSVGHIEDVVVDSYCRGMKLGSRVVTALSETAKASECYKVILDCDEKNTSFYEKCSMQVKGVQMAQYFND